jgi:hypothetical protein
MLFIQDYIVKIPNFYHTFKIYRLLNILCFFKTAHINNIVRMQLFVNRENSVKYLRHNRV